MRPLRRKPKQLDAEPTIFRPPSAAHNGLVLAAAGQRRAPKSPAGGSAAPGESTEVAEVIALRDLATSDDVDLLARQRSQQIARRLALARPIRTKLARRGVGELASVRWRGNSDDMDLDATLDVIAGVPLPEDSDIVVREWVRNRRCVVLAVDVSGSMKGERSRTAAATVGALAAELSRDQVSVIAFWSDAAVLVQLGEHREPLAVLDLLLRVPAKGLTNVAFALELAAQQLANVPPWQSRVLLLSDCVHNAGPDPREIAGRLPRLDVLLDTSSENDLELGRELASLGRGHCRLVHDYHGVAPALATIFDS